VLELCISIVFLSGEITYESGFVFGQTFGNSTVTFGTSTAGGVPPSGARIRIPNVHIGTTSVGAPTTEVNSCYFSSSYWNITTEYKLKR
jgi:hypothetical protein